MSSQLSPVLTAGTSSAYVSPTSCSTSPLVVVGSGCCGVSVAIQLMQAGYNVTLVTDNTTPNTTSDQAGALWRPFGEVPPENIPQFKRWGKVTFDFLNDIRLKYGTDATGVNLVSGYEVFPSARPKPFWHDDVYSFRELSGAELSAMGLRDRGHGWAYTSFIVEMPVYMAFLHRMFDELGGHLVIQRIPSLSDVSRLFPSSQAVVNCVGLAARTFVPDASVTPVAGHILKVKCREIHHFFMDEEECTYIFPRKHDVICGGTYHKQREDTVPHLHTRYDILKRCERLCSDIKYAELVEEYVGLRPYRAVTRLELDGAATTPIVHNYGHGGSGITLHWGCAIDVVQIIAKLNINTKAKIKAKL